MDQVALAVQDSIHAVREITPDLIHPQPIGRGCDPGDLYPARRQLDEEQHYEPLQTSASPYFHGKEVRGHDQFPVPAEKLLPGRLSFPLRGWLDAAPVKNIGNRAARDFVPEV